MGVRGKPNGDHRSPKDREFHGINGGSRITTKILADYKESRDLKHPRDLGDAREGILRKFLRDSGYLQIVMRSGPERTGGFPTGHISNEIDVAFYDPTDSLTLMKRQDVYEVYLSRAFTG